MQEKRLQGISRLKHISKVMHVHAILNKTCAYFYSQMCKRSTNVSAATQLWPHLRTYSKNSAPVMLGLDR